MQIVIKSSSGKGPQEWSIIELQGELRANFQAVLEKAVLGDLHYTNQGEPLLIIGHHVLSGKVSKFERPLAIMECVNANDNENDVKYELQGIVKQKLIFSERPRPIVASTEEEEVAQQ